MIFVYISSRNRDKVRAAREWMLETIGPESPNTWFSVTVDNCDPFRMGSANYRHMAHAWVICDHAHATAFKLIFMSSPVCRVEI